MYACRYVRRCENTLVANCNSLKAVGGPTTKVDQNSKVEMDPRPTD